MRAHIALGIVCVAGGLLYLVPGNAQQAPAPSQPAAHKAMLDRYCVTCHSDQLKTGGLSLQNSDLANLSARPEVWEKVIKKLTVGAMPPMGAPKPAPAAADALVSYLSTSIDREAATHPNPGRVSMHRLNRTEYANAIRDLLGLEIDSAALLPADDEASGFDNIADVLRMSPALMERYLSASWNISRVAVGNLKITPATSVYRVRPDLSQDQHIAGLPLGTRGGMLVKHTFPLNAEYIIKVRLWRNTFDLMRGMEDPHELEIAVDGQPMKTVKVGGREDFVKMAENPGDFGANVDQQLTVRVPVTAGVHEVAAYAILRSHAERDNLVKPFLRTTVDGLDITGDPSVDRISVEGPFNPTGVSETATRKSIFTCRPKSQSDELNCARSILTSLAHRAYRRPLKETDTEPLMSFFQRGRNSGGNFDSGIESALQLILASPEFLVRFEPDPANVPAGGIYKVDDVALASRLSFFLWSSIPDEELLKIAEAGKLHEPAVLKAQTARMLKDPRSIALVDNFFEQWLFLRNLKSSTPDLEAYPDFDDNLRQAMREETRLLIQTVMQEDRNVMDLLNADFTYVNERLARHYGIPNIYGSQFRRIQITDPNRRGLLGQASILTITSYPNRTSAVQRGKWILTNILNNPPLPPPPNVPALQENGEGTTPRSLRARMEMHRTNPVCAGCHKVMDPFGFALEHFDATGRWRALDDGSEIDTKVTLFDGSEVNGMTELRQMLTRKPEIFVGVMTEKMLTYATGRGLEYYDMPSVRAILKRAAGNDYRFSNLIAGIVESTPFQMKTKRAVNPTGGLLE